MVSTRRSSSRKQQRKAAKGIKAAALASSSNAESKPKRIVFGDDDHVGASKGLDGDGENVAETEIASGEKNSGDILSNTLDGNNPSVAGGIDDDDDDAPMEISMSQAREDVSRARKAEFDAAPKVNKRKRPRQRTKELDDELPLDVIQDMMREQQEQRDRAAHESESENIDGPVVVKFKGSRKKFEEHEDAARDDGFKLVVLGDGTKRTAESIARKRAMAPKASSFLEKFLGGARHGPRVSLAAQKAKKTGAHGFAASQKKRKLVKRA